MEKYSEKVFHLFFKQIHFHFSNFNSYAVEISQNKKHLQNPSCPDKNSNHIYEDTIPSGIVCLSLNTIHNIWLLFLPSMELSIYLQC